MLPGFNKIVEERIRKAQKKGEFENLEGAGKPLTLEEDQAVAEELRLAYKILKNADCLPPEIELKKQIQQTEELLAGMTETAEKYRTIKKLNFLIMKLNTIRQTAVVFEEPQKYSDKLIKKLKSCVRKQRSEDRGQKTEVRKQRSEDRGQMPEARKQEPENRSQRSGQ